MDGDSDVRVEEGVDPVAELLHEPPDFVRTVLPDYCHDEHEAGDGGPHHRPQLHHCRRKHHFFFFFFFCDFGFVGTKENDKTNRK